MFAGFPEHIPEPHLKYAFFDPGKITGWAVYDESGTLRFFGQANDSRELDRVLATLPDSVEYYIYEEWITRPGYNFAGSKMHATRAIGHIESAATFRHKRYDNVQPSQKTIGYRRLGVKPPSDHSKSHAWDAIAHGEVWVWKNKVRKEWMKLNEAGYEGGGTAPAEPDGLPESGVV